MAQIVVEVSRQVEASAPEAFEVISDFERNPSWQKGMRSCRWTTDPPLRVGSTYVQEAGFLGRTIESTFEVIEYEPGRRVKATTIAGSFPITFARTVTPSDGGARIDARIEGDASGFFRIATPLMRFMVRRSIEADYDRLARMLEQG